MERLAAAVFGNPHSESAASQASTDALNEARALTLRLFEADPAEYEVIFTANASSAIRILAEAFPFGRRSRLVMTADNHNSVNGLRVAARQRGAAVAYVPLDPRLCAVRIPVALLSPAAGPSLFAFPAQSNFSGVRHPLAWVSRGAAARLPRAARCGGVRRHEPPVVVDGSGRFRRDLLLQAVRLSDRRRRACWRGATRSPMLRRRFFAGGTVQFVSVQNDRARAKAGAEAFEDGTPNFLAMPAVCDGLRWFQDLGIDAIERHVAGLTAALLRAARRDWATASSSTDRARHDARGGSVAFNLQRGGRIAAVRRRSKRRRESTAWRSEAAASAIPAPPNVPSTTRRTVPARACARPFSVSRFRTCLGGPPVGALRASVGVPTNGADLDRLIDCLRR